MRRMWCLGRMTGMKVLVAVLAGVLALLLGFLIALPAEADGFALCYGSQGQSVCLPDNKEHTYCWSDTFEQDPVMTDAGNHAIDLSTQFGFAGVARGPAAASLATVTVAVTDYGHERSDTAAESDLDLLIRDRQAWVVLWHDV